MKKILLLAVSALMSVFCVAQTKNVTRQKSLVLYYSQTGTTKVVADEIRKLTGADIAVIELEKPYSGDFQQTIARCQDEKGKGILPVLKPLKADVSKYDVIYLGYPIWFGTYAPPVEALVKKVTFEGKTIVPFCTFGSGGLEVSVRDLRKALPKATVKDGYGVRTARKDAVSAEVDRFLKENGYIAGKVEPLPDYSVQKPVTDAEKKLFDEACSNYQFPLGTPVTVGKRSTKAGTDYKFTVKSRGMDGKDAESVILVTVKKGAKAEFTRVIR